jgi:hypothetical protein
MLSAAKNLTQRTRRFFAALSMTFLIAFPKLPTDLAGESSSSRPGGDARPVGARDNEKTN